MAMQFESPMWKRSVRKRAGKRSETPGKSKGECCTTGGFKKFFASHPHAYMNKHYPAWHKKFVERNHGK